jgi:hypothetical protein
MQDKQGNNQMDKQDNPGQVRLADVLTEMGRGVEEANSHPSEQTLAAFLDGTLAEMERDGVARHLAFCADCRDIYLLSADLTARTNNAGRNYPTYWIELVAVAVMVLGFYVVLSARHITAPDVAVVKKTNEAVPNGNDGTANNQRVELPIRDPAAYAENLVRGGLPKGLLAENNVSAGERESFSFGGEMEMRQNFFRIGAGLMRLSIGLELDDRVESQKLIGHLIPLFSRAKMADAVAEHYLAIRGRIGEGAPPRQFRKDELAYQIFLKQTKSGAFVDFGVWVEAGRISSQKKSGRELWQNEVPRFLSLSVKEGLPKGVVESLNELDTLARKGGVWSEEDYRRIGRLFVRIAEVMS